MTRKAKGKRKKRLTDKQAKGNIKRLKHYACTILIIGIVFILWELDYYERTLDSGRLFWIFALLGILFGSFQVLMINYKYNKWIKYQDFNKVIPIGIVSGWFLFLPALASYLNTNMKSPDLYCKSVPILKKKTDHEEISFNVDLQVNGKKERLSIDYSLWERINTNDLMYLCYQEGILGYNIVMSLDKAP